MNTSTYKWEEPMSKTKSFNISKIDVLKAYRCVRENKGSAGIDGQTLLDFEKDCKNNLYKIWNRMSSGSYFPPPVLRVEIPKSDGKMRPLGIPTVSDRIAQMVVKLKLEPLLEPIFHKDSYGYRPNKSALDAVGIARERCWAYDWVIDLDIKGFFDNIDHELMMRAVRTHIDEKWVLLYIERWLKASVQMKDGSIIERDKGTPQGGVISPLLANLFLHYTFDMWMVRNYSEVPFERYADDCIVHCKTLIDAEELLLKLHNRFENCKLELHSEKTKIVYCKDDRRPYDYINDKFDFLGYTFCGRKTKSKHGKLFIGFNPAVSSKAIKSIKESIRNWHIKRLVGLEIGDIAKRINPVIRGWLNYYGKFRISEMYPTLSYLNNKILGWIRKKYKKFRKTKNQAIKWLFKQMKEKENLFAHWKLGKLLWIGQ
jgi:RNA-directed DNA polymerase